MKVVIADPQVRVRRSMGILLEQQPGWTTEGEAADSQELLRLLQDRSPELVLVEWDLPGLSAENLLHLLRAQFPGLLILSMSARQEVGPIALKSGASAFACKTDSPLKLLRLIQELRTRVE